MSREGSADQMFVNFPWRNYFLQSQEKSWFAYALEKFGHSFADTVALDYRYQVICAKKYMYQFLQSSKIVLKSTCASAFNQKNMETPGIRSYMVV